MPKKQLSAVKEGAQAGEGNRTLVSSLGSWCSTIELHPLAMCFRLRQPSSKHRPNHITDTHPAERARFLLDFGSISDTVERVDCTSSDDEGPTMRLTKLRICLTFFLTTLVFQSKAIGVQVPNFLLGDSPSNVGEAGKCYVVCPPAFREALKSWIDYREQQGFEITVVSPEPSANQTKKSLLTAGLDASSAAVLLVGDCRITAAESVDVSKETPTFYRTPGPTAKWGTTATLAGDAPFGDIDGDAIPDVPVGRLSVDSPGQLAGIVKRVMEYENSSDFGEWRDTVQITAGVGGFGMLADAAIESATRSVLTTAVPPSTRLSVTYCSPTSDFNPGPNDFFQSVLRRYQQGGAFWVYLGHGNVTELDRVPGPGGSKRSVLASDDVSLLESPASSAPIAVMLACYTGAFDATVDCLAEQMLFAEGGPIAVLAGSRVTMPYGNSIAAQGLINSFYNAKTENLGTAWLQAQRELATDAKDDLEIAERRKLVDLLATAVSPAADQLPDERLEHLHLYNLLGDPLLKLTHPGEVKLEVPRSIVAGTPLTIRGEVPQDGELTVAVRHLPGNVPIDRELSQVERYEQANQGEIASVRIEQLTTGPFETTIVLPADIKGPVYVVARIKSDNQWSVGAERILVRP